MPRVNLTEWERELVEAFRAERNIYNGAIADCLAAIADLTDGDGFELPPSLNKAILALRRKD
jgi:hypothetical protein